MGLKGIMLWSKLHGKQDEKENTIFEQLYEFLQKHNMYKIYKLQHLSLA